MQIETTDKGQSTGDTALDGILLRVGKLNYTWTNTESLFIHLIAGLASVEKDVAIVVFLTLNTTTARLDLVDRLAKLPSTPDEHRAKMLELTKRFRKESALRNKYNHCIYSFDPDGGPPNTIMMRIADRKDKILVGRQQKADDQEIANIDDAISRLSALNLDIWKAIIELDYPI